MTDHIIELYRKARERARVAYLRGEEDVEVHEGIADALWKMMSEADRRELLGVGDHQTKAA